MGDDLNRCPDCGARMRLYRSEPYGTLRQRYRECDCGRRDRQLVRPAEQVANPVVISKSGSLPDGDAAETR